MQLGRKLAVLRLWEGRVTKDEGRRRAALRGWVLETLETVV